MEFSSWGNSVVLFMSRCTVGVYQTSAIPPHKCDVWYGGNANFNDTGDIGQVSGFPTGMRKSDPRLRILRNQK